MKRRAEPRIVDISTHPRSSVCLAVAAEFLGIDERTVRARIKAGRLQAVNDGKVYRITLIELIRYEQQRVVVPRTTTTTTKSASSTVVEG